MFHACETTPQQTHSNLFPSTDVERFNNESTLHRVFAVAVAVQDRLALHLASKRALWGTERECKQREFAGRGETPTGAGQARTHRYMFASASVSQESIKSRSFSLRASRWRRISSFAESNTLSMAPCARSSICCSPCTTPWKIARHLRSLLDNTTPRQHVCGRRDVLRMHACVQAVPCQTPSSEQPLPPRRCWLQWPLLVQWRRRLGQIQSWQQARLPASHTQHSMVSET